MQVLQCCLAGFLVVNAFHGQRGFISNTVASSSAHKCNQLLLSLRRVML